MPATDHRSNDLVESLAKVEREFFPFSERLRSKWESRPKETDPGRLYHYTDSNALLSILRHGVMWATNVRYLNDSSELVYATEVLEDVVKESAHRCPKDGLVSVLLERLRGRLNAFDDPSLNAYVICFCEDSDLLSQWRTYGAKGGGYAIGFDRSRMAKYIGDNQPLKSQYSDIDEGQIADEFFLTRVEYDLVEQRRFLKMAIGWVVNLLRRKVSKSNFNSSDKEELIDKYVRFLRAQVASYLPSIKHPKFEEEKEWRVVYIGGDISEDESNLRDVQYRVSLGNITPYLELRLSDPKHDQPSLPIAEVRSGPTLQRDLARRSLEALRRKHQYHRADVTVSETPLRA